jgi:hypothetical protein
MISSNEFILFYNEIFKYLDKNFGKKEVKKLWKNIKNNYCKKLDILIKEKGLEGIFELFSKNMLEEGGRYCLILRENDYVEDIHYCPSVGKLLNTHVEPYKDYCEHCPALYNDIYRKNGFEVDTYIINREKGECRTHIWKKSSKPSAELKIIKKVLN